MAGSVLDSIPEEERRRVSEILKSHGGLDTVYWGGWITEHM